MGKCTRDTEVKFTPNGTAIGEMGLAVNRRYTTESGEKREEVLFVDIEFWGKPAEIAGEYAKKGKSVHIEGRLKLDQWDDKQTGQKRSKMRVVGEGMQLLGSRDGGDAQQEPRQQPTSRPSAPPPRPKPKPVDPDLDAKDPEDDVPF